MTAGDTKTVTIVEADAYGPHLEQLVSEIDKKHLPENLPIEIGQHLEISEKEEKTPIIVTITKVSDDTITVDANHPLAGKDLVFDLELIEIN